MENHEIYLHYLKRMRLCSNIVAKFRLNRLSPKYDRFISLYKYYDNKIKCIDLSIGNSTAGGGNYTKQLRPIKEILLDKYIDIYYSDFKKDHSNLRKLVSETIGFNQYVISFHVNNLGSTIKSEISASASLAKSAFEKFIKSIKK